MDPVDRTEDNNFLAMLQLAPRNSNSIEPAPIHTHQSVGASEAANSDTGAAEVKPLQVLASLFNHYLERISKILNSLSIIYTGKEQ